MNDRNSVAAKPDLVQQAKHQWYWSGGVYIYLKGADVPLAVCGMWTSLPGAGELLS